MSQVNIKLITLYLKDVLLTKNPFWLKGRTFNEEVWEPILNLGNDIVHMYEE